MTVNVQRLEKLALALDAYQASPGAADFDLENWTSVKKRRGGFLWLREVECGTAACAVGLACLSGIFADEGLSHYRLDDGGIVPIFGDTENWQAVQAFFGLTRKQSHRLFDSDKYEISKGPIAAAAVARRIRATVNKSLKARKPKAPQRTDPVVAEIKAKALEGVS